MGYRVHHVAAVLAWVLPDLLAHHHAVVDEQADIEYEKYHAENYQVGAHHVIALSVCLEGHHSENREYGFSHVGRYVFQV